MNDKKRKELWDLCIAFEEAFKTAVYSKENRLSNWTKDGFKTGPEYKVNWNFVDADLCLDGWDKKVGKDYINIFDRMAKSHEMFVKLAYPKMYIG